METVTEDQFDEQFTLIDVKGQQVLEWEDVRGKDPAYIWTWMDGDLDDSTYLVPGVHIVNKFGFALTKEPHTDTDIFEVRMDGPDA